MVPCVVSAEKSGASELMRSDIGVPPGECWETNSVPARGWDACSPTRPLERIAVDRRVRQPRGEPGLRLTDGHAGDVAPESASISRLLASFASVASGDLLIPGRMKRPGPRLTDRASGHRLERSGLAKSA